MKEKRRPKLAEFSFILPEFKVQQHENANLSSLAVSVGDENHLDAMGLNQYYQREILEKQLAFNQFVSVKELVNIDVTVEKAALFQLENQGKTIEPVLVNGYDGFGGVHDNLLWSPSTGMITYTLHNKVIVESTRTR